MLPHPARRTLVALLLALQATLSFCGPGHHAGPSVAAGASRDPGEHAPGMDRATDPHCPICDYLCHVGLLPAERPPALIHRVETAGFRPDRTPDAAPPPCPSRPRAPPSFDAI
ncbi:hypothetical protein TA3x_000604 [Tundrisphaera sp. TA3]|uniref:hypothetical protein n=1 Tax=Tundrisphaera sp. TA3 TaxID=3435775 RepID=UPI003EBB7975